MKPSAISYYTLFRVFTILLYVVEIIAIFKNYKQILQKYEHKKCERYRDLTMLFIMTFILFTFISFAGLLVWIFEKLPKNVGDRPWFGTFDMFAAQACLTFALVLITLTFQLVREYGDPPEEECNFSYWNPSTLGAYWLITAQAIIYLIFSAKSEKLYQKINERCDVETIVNYC